MVDGLAEGPAGDGDDDGQPAAADRDATGGQGEADATAAAAEAAAAGGQAAQEAAADAEDAAAAADDATAGVSHAAACSLRQLLGPQQRQQAAAAAAELLGSCTLQQLQAAAAAWGARLEISGSRAVRRSGKRGGRRGARLRQQQRQAAGRPEPDACTVAAFPPHVPWMDAQRQVNGSCWMAGWTSRARPHLQLPGRGVCPSRHVRGRIRQARHACIRRQRLPQPPTNTCRQLAGEPRFLPGIRASPS